LTWLVAQFSKLRDDSQDAADERQEAVAAIAFLVGVALTVASSAAASFADDPARRGLIIPVWLFVAGVLVGAVNYWLGGGALHIALNLLGGKLSYRQTRHLLAYAAAPFALSLVLLPIRLAIWGGAIFRSGGADSGTGNHVFLALTLVFGAAALAAAALGIRIVLSWSWPRAIAAVAAFAVLAAILDLALQLFG
jgi:hypothetical protein